MKNLLIPDVEDRQHLRESVNWYFEYSTSGINRFFIVWIALSTTPFPVCVRVCSTQFLCLGFSETLAFLSDCDSPYKQAQKNAF